MRSYDLDGICDFRCDPFVICGCRSHHKDDVDVRHIDFVEDVVGRRSDYLEDFYVGSNDLLEDIWRRHNAFTDLHIQQNY